MASTHLVDGLIRENSAGEIDVGRAHADEHLGGDLVPVLGHLIG